MLDNLWLLLPAWLAGALVLSTHVPLGQRVLARGIIFIDLAIAQWASLGVLLAYLGHFEESGWLIQIIAFSTALMAAMVFQFFEKHCQKQLEALIGCSFVLAATASILLLAQNTHAAEHLHDVLVGQILWVTPAALAYTAILYLAVGLVFGLMHKMGKDIFYPLFAVCITAAVQLLGIYLVFATLIIPALATATLQGKLRLMIAYMIGIAGYTSGLWLSLYWDVPSGALIVWCLASFALLIFILLKLEVLLKIYGHIHRKTSPQS